MKNTILLLVFVMSVLAGIAQNVGINSDGTAPDGSAMLDVKSLTKGFLAPRVASTANVTSPVEGLLVYQTGGTAGFYYYTGSAWTLIGTGSGNGTLTDVTGTAPVVSSGGTTPAISITAASTGAAGSMSAADKTKLDGIAAAATNYTHPTGDGNLHVIATGTSNSGKVLTAGITAGSVSWTAPTSGTVTSVTGTSPISVATGASTPVISLGTVPVANGGTGTATGSITGSGALTFTAGTSGGANQNVTLTPSGTGYTLLNGNVGIGMSPLVYKFNVLESSSDYAAFIGNHSNSSSANGLLIKAGSNYTPYSAIMIGFQSVSGTMMGSISQTAAYTVLYNTTSDRRLKNNIVNTHFGITDLMKIQVRDYVYKADASKTQVTGFIAQELYEIFPNAVTKPAKAEDMWSVDYGKVTPLLVKVIQDQQAAIEVQQKQIDELKTQNTAIKADNSSLKAENSSIKADVEALKNAVYGTSQTK